jgi:hypothetical protein
MTIQMPQNDSNALDLRVVQVFASRVGRKCFLEHFCETDHPVLMTERELVEIARSKMLEQFIIHPQSNWPALQKIMMRMARHWVASHVDDHETSDRILRRIKEEIVEIIPKIH